MLVFSVDTGNVEDFLIKGYQFLNVNYPRFHKMDNLSKIGILAAEVLLKDTDTRRRYEAADVGVVITNASASLDTDLAYFQTMQGIPSPSLFVYTLPNIMIGEICIKNNFQGENAFFVFQQFNGNFIHQYVSILFNTTPLQACICGWVELVGGQYKTVLYLIERKPANRLPVKNMASTASFENTSTFIEQEQIIFTPDNVNALFNKQ